MSPRRRLIEGPPITIRRTVATAALARPRAHWTCRVFRACRAEAVARGADLWSTVEKAAIAAMMRAAA